MNTLRQHVFVQNDEFDDEFRLNRASTHEGL